MLLRKNFGGRHQCGLISVFDRGNHRNHGDDRFAAANITLKQAIHWLRRLHVVEDLNNDFALCARQLKRQHRRDGSLNSVVNPYRCFFSLLNSLASFQPNRKVSQKKSSKIIRTCARLRICS